MDPLRLSIALGPLAAYLMVLGLINLRQKPFVTTGSRDLFALAIGVSGMMLIGPMTLFMPGAAAAYFGIYTWALMLCIYFLLVVFITLMQRPRLIIYNMTPESLKPILRELATKLDEDARWAGETLILPGLSIHLVIESNPAMHNIQLKSVGPQKNYLTWIRLRIALSFALSKHTSIPNLYGYALIAVASALILTSGLELFNRPDLVKVAIKEMLMQ